MKQHGAILNTEGVDCGTTCQCPHCDMHFRMVRGSGVQRGFCYRCHRVTCGRPACHVCTPFEKKLDLFEKGKIHLL